MSSCRSSVGGVVFPFFLHLYWWASNWMPPATIAVPMLHWSAQQPDMISTLYVGYLPYSQIYFVDCHIKLYGKTKNTPNSGLVQLFLFLSVDERLPVGGLGVRSHNWMWAFTVLV